MNQSQRGNPKLLKAYKKWLKEDIFAPVRDRIVSIDWSPPSTFPQGFECWAWAREESVNVHTIRLNSLAKDLEAPDHVIEYLVAHEMIHMLPGCQVHGETFWNYEIGLLGESYYKATVWLRTHRPLFKKRYAYRQRKWLEEMIRQDQLRIKDMAEICECHPSTIRRWLKKYDLKIV